MQDKAACSWYQVFLLTYISRSYSLNQVNKHCYHVYKLSDVGIYCGGFTTCSLRVCEVGTVGKISDCQP